MIPVALVGFDDVDLSFFTRKGCRRRRFDCIALQVLQFAFFTVLGMNFGKTIGKMRFTFFILPFVNSGVGGKFQNQKYQYT